MEPCVVPSPSRMLPRHGCFFFEDIITLFENPVYPFSHFRLVGPLNLCSLPCCLNCALPPSAGFRHCCCPLSLFRPAHLFPRTSGYSQTARRIPPPLVLLLILKPVVRGYPFRQHFPSPFLRAVMPNEVHYRCSEGALPTRSLPFSSK